MDLWNEVCKLVQEQKKKNVTEQEFQSFIESLFSDLGWSKIRKEIVSQESLPVGAGNSLIPDIIIKANGQNLFVIELKRPAAPAADQHEKQLASYMLQLQLSFGLYIGEVIHVLFNNPADNNPPKRVAIIKFNPDNPDGKELLELVNKDGFSENAVILYCENKLKQLNENDIANKIIENLTAPDSVDPIIDNLLIDLGNHVKHYHNVGDSIVEKVKEEIKIKIEDERGPDLIDTGYVSNGNVSVAITKQKTSSEDDQIYFQLFQNMYQWLEEYKRKGLLLYDVRQNKNFFSFYTPLMNRLLPDYDSNSAYYYYFLVRNGQNPFVYFELTNHGMPVKTLETVNKIAARFNKKPVTNDDTYRRIIRWRVGNVVINSDSDPTKVFTSLKTSLDEIITQTIPAFEKIVQQALSD